MYMKKLIISLLFLFVSKLSIYSQGVTPGLQVVSPNFSEINFIINQAQEDFTCDRNLICQRPCENLNYTISIELDEEGRMINDAIGDFAYQLYQDLENFLDGSQCIGEISVLSITSSINVGPNQTSTFWISINVCDICG
jgi:hypothetical protein